MQFSSDPELFAAYQGGIGEIARVTRGMSPEQLLAHPVAGRWSTHEVIIHLADAENAFSHRLKRIVAEENPTFPAWSENGFIANLAYDAQSAGDAIALIDLERRQLIRILDAVGLSVLDRSGTHAERGPQTARRVMKYAVWHLSHHLSFVKEKKAALGL